MGTKFKGNTTITKFNEMARFINLVLTYDAFQNCTSLTEVSTPPKLTALDRSFMGCNAMRKIHFNDGFKELGYAKLQLNSTSGRCRLYLPSSFTTFGNLWNYDNKTFTLIMASETVLANNPGNGAYAVYVPDTAVNAYKTAWSSIASKIHPMSEWTE